MNSLITRRTRRTRRRSLLVVVLLTALVAPLVVRTAAGAAPGDPREVLAWSDDLNATTVKGANQPLMIWLGTMTYEQNCPGGEPDLIYPGMDVYIVPTGTAHIGGTLADAGGGAPYTVSSVVPTGEFVDETIGYTAPGGKIRPGVYDIVYDECQDHVFDIRDGLFVGALTVTTDPLDAPPLPDLSAVKDAARAARDNAVRMLGIYELTTLIRTSSSGSGGGGSGSIGGRIPFLANPRSAVKHILENEIAHYRRIISDPPDPGFGQADVPMGAEIVDPLSNGPFEAGSARLATALSSQGSALDALVHSIERYNGAGAVGDGAWELTHARAVRDTAGVAAAQSDVVAADASALGDAIPSAGLPTDAELADLQGFADRVRTSGFSAEELDELDRLGFDPAAVTALHDYFSALEAMRLSTGSIRAALAELVERQEAFGVALRALAEGVRPVVAALEAGVAPLAPVVEAGGPYSGAEGATLRLGGSATPGGDLDFRWDVNGDGSFDDASGPAPIVALGAAREGLVTLMATDPAGHVGTAYARLSVGDAEHRAVVDAAFPAASSVTVAAGATAAFSVVAHDPEGEPVTTTWSLDGSTVGSGPGWSFAPRLAQVGVHELVALSTDSSPLGGGVRRSWAVLVERLPDPSGPPIVVPTVSPRPDPGGWTNRDTTVTWSVYDPAARSLDTAGCGQATLTADTPGTTMTCSATDTAGLSTAVSTTVKLDKTAPSASATASSRVNGAVTVNLTADDAGGSGVTSIRYSFEGAQTGGGVLAAASGSVAVTASGMTYLVYAAGDQAGNWQAPSVLPVANEQGAADYVVDPHYALQVFASGFPTRVCPGCGGEVGPVGVAFDSTNDLLVTDIASGNLHRFGPSGGVAGPANQVNTSHLYGDPIGIAYSKTGHLYLARQYFDDLVEIDPTNGSVIRGLFWSYRSAPTALAIDPISGDLFVSLFLRHSVIRMSGLDGGPIGITTYAELADVVDGLTFAPDGTLYAAVGEHDDAKVVAIAGTDSTSPGTVTEVATVPTADGVAVARSGAGASPVVIANRNDGLITRIDLSTNPPTLTDIVTHANRGDFVTVGPDGCLYATQSSAIVKITNADGTCDLAPSSAQPQLRLTPLLVARTVGSSHMLTVQVVGPALPDGTPVTFTVAGPNAQTVTVAEDATNVASFSYTGLAEGVDEITASAGGPGGALVSNPVRAVWATAPPDALPPSTTAVPSPPANAGGWNNGDVAVALTAVDDAAGSGVKQIRTLLAGAQTGDAVAAGAATSVLISAEGETTLSYAATDNAGNDELPARLDVRVDKTAPTVSESIAPIPSSGWVGTDATVRMAATDEPGGSGVAALSYGMSGAQTGNGSGTAFAATTISAEGTTAVTFTATDRAGNASAPKALTVQVDKSAPWTDVSVSPAPNAAGWSRSDATITLSAHDAGAGAKQITYVLDGAERRRGTIPAASGAITVSTPGVTTITYFATDVVGNVEAARTLTVRIDKVAPETWAVPSVGPNDQGVFAGPVLVRLRAADVGGSGTRALTYSLTGAQSGTGSFAGSHADVNVTAPGTTILAFSAADGAGNQEAVKQLAVTIGAGRPTAVVYTGDTHAAFNDAATLAGVLTDTSTEPPTPVAGAALAFRLGVQACAATTDSAGRASCSVTPFQPPGPSPVEVRFTGTGTYEASSTTAAFTIEPEDTALAYGGATTAADGGSATLTATLTEDGATPVTQRAVTLTLGDVSSAQSCSAVTSVAGVASCTISPVAQRLGPAPATATFAGDGSYRAASTSATVVVFAGAGGGFFTVGGPAIGAVANAAGTAVVFWGAQWAKANGFGPGAAPADFKGFVSAEGVPACGTTWSSRPGNSPGPPSGVPEYVAVAAADSITRSGSMIAGHTTHVVVVKTDPGYGADPGHAGTGVVVAVVC